MKIAVIVPTIREEAIKEFKKEWQDLFNHHSVDLYVVWDGDNPYVEKNDDEFIYFNQLPNDVKTLIRTHTSAVRNFGFYAAYNDGADIFITLDDDVSPIGDPIQDHINALNMKVPLSWLSTTLAGKYMRGFPYNIRAEAPVMLSHGIWLGVPDLDAPTQLLEPDMQPKFYQGTIPRGVLFPMCGMNVAFKREIAPMMYWCNSVDIKGAERFDDIWAGIEIKKEMDKIGLAAVSGYAIVHHNRLSNVYASLQKEAVGIGLNEKYWKGEHDDFYKNFINNRELWRQILMAL